MSGQIAVFRRPAWGGELVRTRREEDEGGWKGRDRPIRAEKAKTPQLYSCCLAASFRTPNRKTCRRRREDDRQVGQLCDANARDRFRTADKIVD